MKRLLATLLLSSGLASAERWIVSRDKQIPGEGINYRVCRVVVPSMTTLGTTSGASLVITANSSDQISVVAFNELGEAQPSVPITLPAPSGRIYAVTIKNNKSSSVSQRLICLRL